MWIEKKTECTSESNTLPEPANQTQALFSMFWPNISFEIKEFRQPCTRFELPHLLTSEIAAPVCANEALFIFIAR